MQNRQRRQQRTAQPAATKQSASKPDSQPQCCACALDCVILSLLAVPGASEACRALALGSSWALFHEHETRDRSMHARPKLKPAAPEIEPNDAFKVLSTAHIQQYLQNSTVGRDIIACADVHATRYITHLQVRSRLYRRRLCKLILSYFLHFLALVEQDLHSFAALQSQNFRFFTF